MPPRNYRYAMKRSGRTFPQSKPLNKTEKKQVAKIAKTVVSKSIETKFHDIANIAFPSDGLGTIVPLTDIAQSAGASTDSTRVGDQLSPLNVEMRFAAAAGVLASITTPTTMRVIVVQWHGEFANDPPTTAKIFGAVGATTLAPLRPYNHDNRKKFRVLYDRMLELGYNSDSIHVWSKKLSMKVKPVKYYAGSTTNQMDGLYMILQSGVDILGVLPNLSYVIRTNFKDA